jgi:hypothetical protein
VKDDRILPDDSGRADHNSVCMAEDEARPDLGVDRNIDVKDHLIRASDQPGRQRVPVASAPARDTVERHTLHPATSEQPHNQVATRRRAAYFGSDISS